MSWQICQGLSSLSTGGIGIQQESARRIILDNGARRVFLCLWLCERDQRAIIPLKGVLKRVPCKNAYPESPFGRLCPARVLTCSGGASNFRVLLLQGSA